LVGGTLCVASSSSYYLAVFGRLLIGTGSAAAFLAVNKLAIQWFPENKQALFFSLTLVMGIMGALNGGRPLVYLLDTYGLHGSLYVLSALGVVVLLLNFIFVHDKKEIINTHDLKSNDLNKPSYKQVLTYPSVWILGLASLGGYMGLQVFGNSWGIEFLMASKQMTKLEASDIISFLFYGVLIGSLLVGILGTSSKFNANLFLKITLGIYTIAMTIFVYQSSVLDNWMLCSLLFIFGFSAGSSILFFVAAVRQFSKSVAGTVTGMMNTIQMFGCGFGEHCVGVLLSNTTPQDGVYSLNDYQYSLSLLIIMGAIAFIFSFMIKTPKTIEA
jgi:predicted MFS family arabinose efflux permease